MSEDVRRPRRIIAGPQEPPHEPARPQPATVQQSDRFRRALAEGRGDGRMREGLRGERTGTRLPAAPSAPSSTATRPASASAQASNAAGAASLGPLAEVPPSAFLLGGTAANTLADERDPTSGMQRGAVQGAGFSSGGGSAWDAELVRVIATLCRKADPGFEAWSVVIPIDGRVLPETELRLGLSAQRLSLRFHTQSQHSLTLVLRHREALAGMLQEALPALRDIDIDVT